MFESIDRMIQPDDHVGREFSMESLDRMTDTHYAQYPYMSPPLSSSDSCSVSGSERGREFKVGDRVKVVGPCHSSQGDKGKNSDEGKICEKCNWSVGVEFFRIKGIGTTAGYPSESLELISSEKRRPTVGDKVRILSDTSDYAPIGDIYAVTKVDYDNGGYDGEVKIDWEGGYWLYEREVELVTPKQREFKVGSRVKIVGPCVNRDEYRMGAYGVIEDMNCLSAPSQGPIKVRYGQELGKWIGLPVSSLQLLEE